MSFSVLAFPVENSIIGLAMENFDKNKELVLVVAPVVFLARILINQMFFKDARSYGDLLMDLALMMAFLAMFPSLIDLIQEIPQMAESFITNSQLTVEVETLYPTNMTVWESLTTAISMVKSFSIIAYWLSFALYQGIMFMLIAMAAWVIMAGTLMNVRFVLPIFVFCILVTSLWPVAWYGLNYIIIHIADQIGTIGAHIMGFGGDVLRLAIPVYLLSKAWHTKLTDSIRGAVSGTKFITEKTSSTAKSITAGSTRSVISAASALGFSNEMSSLQQRVHNTKNRIKSYQTSVKNASAFKLASFGPGVKSGIQAAKMRINRQEQSRQNSVSQTSRNTSLAQQNSSVKGSSSAAKTNSSSSVSKVVNTQINTKSPPRTIGDGAVNQPRNISKTSIHEVRTKTAVSTPLKQAGRGSANLKSPSTEFKPTSQMRFLLKNDPKRGI